MPVLLPPRSSTGHDAWAFDSDLGVWRASTSLGQPELCLGDRHAGPEAWPDSKATPVRWWCAQSSWGRQGFAADLASAAAWVRGASLPEAGCALWSRDLHAERLAEHSAAQARSLQARLRGTRRAVLLADGREREVPVRQLLAALAEPRRVEH